jgi:hypothetical protein
MSWLRPEVYFRNTPGTRIIDIRLPNTFSFEYIEYEECTVWYSVIQLLGFGICINIMRDI